VDTENAVRLLDSATKLLGVMIWPAVVAFILVRFGSKISEVIGSLSEFTFKGAGFEASARKRQTEAAAALVAASASRPEAGATPETLGNAARQSVQIIGELSPRNLRQIEGTKVLWVDDNPDNNTHERQSLEALGVRFVLSTSTDDALNKVKIQKFDAIISDMGRPPDHTAGYTLLDALRSSGDQTPFIIYASSRAPEHQAEAKRRGAVGCTNRPTELFAMVLSVLNR
jgi:CheY-like chemotaxis protein